MKIEFTQAPKGRDYKVGDVVDFDGSVEETYARKFIARGWAKPVDSAAKQAKDKMETEAKQTQTTEAADKAKYKTAVETGQRGPGSQK